MPLVFKLKAEWGDSLYLKSDEHQDPKTLIGIRLGPGFVIYELRSGEDILEAYDFETTSEPDPNKKYGIPTDNED